MSQDYDPLRDSKYDSSLTAEEVPQIQSINININVNATESQPPPVVIKRFVNPLIILSPIVDQQQSNVRDYEYIS